jgi:hypothetical protein
VNGIEAKSIDVKLGHPVQRVVDDVPANFVVERRTPGRFVALGKVRSVRVEVVPFGAEVVVDDVEDDGEAFRVGRVHEGAELLGSAVGALRSIEMYAVVPPVPCPRKLRHGHDLDGGDSQRSPRRCGMTPRNVPSSENVPTCSS